MKRTKKQISDTYQAGYEKGVADERVRVKKVIGDFSKGYDGMNELLKILEKV